MTPKQKIKSNKLKMQRIKKNNPEIDFDKIHKNYKEIKRYNDLFQDNFWIEFELNHCEKCGKKI